ncbi:hypothetical protein [Methanosarcina barkeri]|uniref:hypothetical protein n=1 Tax=Methanosarcina barkeri TaxID=2208 RepID=UPI00064ED47C|nr:hypothetical protein [Methanosarcina barkeri]
MNFISIHNKIKGSVSEDWLTDSQKNILTNILDNKIHDLINVYGPDGVGKTFLGWALQKRNYATYFSDIENVIEGCHIAVIDNGNSSFEEYKTILKIMELKRIKRVIYLSRNKLDAKVYSLNLALTATDIEKVVKNINSVGLNIYDLDCDNLWVLIFKKCRCYI